MKNKLTIIICLFSVLFLHTCYADYQTKYSEHVIPCARELQDCLSKIQQLPEAQELIKKIQTEGMIQIIINNDPNLTKQFGAFWDPINRVITVNYFKGIPTGSLIGSIIFEMHNALVTSKMLKLDNLAATRKIDRDTYIEEFERLEYKNSKDASKLVRKGIQKGVFPENAHLPTYSSFEEHYYVQKEAGHSEFIGRNFDHLAPRYHRSFR